MSEMTTEQRNTLEYLIRKRKEELMQYLSLLNNLSKEGIKCANEVSEALKILHKIMIKERIPILKEEDARNLKSTVNKMDIKNGHHIDPASDSLSFSVDGIKNQN
ncbi:hypothetical protein [Bacillus sp. Marseille-P3800]|uniref:hypothetical protein n=1 Tax=Bacillus sp. Marseille-P3800 TaxID=2014782 RepID=UPI000C06F166|nr:hypothetical protein [Bacillus sp. Marseille-P3800]